MKNQIKFTPVEWEILQHRLDAPCAIAECLADWEDLTDHKQIWETDSYKRIYDRAYDLSVKGQDEINWDNPEDVAIIEDAAEGSTMFTDFEDAIFAGELSRGKALALQKAAKSIERKLDVEIPRW